MGKKIKVYGKIKLLETSVVGIPAYPDAHASVDSFSLIKSVSKAFVDEAKEISDSKILKKEEIMVEETVQTSTVKTSETPIVEKAVEVEKSVDNTELIVKTIKEGLKDALKEIETGRGLVQKQEVQVKKTLAEGLIENGFFVKY
jgi:hypothetical protein